MHYPAKIKGSPTEDAEDGLMKLGTHSDRQANWVPTMHACCQVARGGGVSQQLTLWEPTFTETGWLFSESDA